VTNIATATDGTTSSPQASETIGAVSNSALTLVKSSNTSGFEAAGDVLSYSYLVTNTGNVTLTDALSVTDDKIQTVNCPSLPAGGLVPTASLTCTADYIVTEADIDAGGVTNIASASSGDVQSPTDDVSVSLIELPALDFVKSALSVGFTNPGDIISYAYDVTNAGNIVLTDPVSVTDDKIANVICPALPIGGLPRGETLTCLADYVVTQDDLNNGSVTNIASAQSGDVSSDPMSVTVQADIAPSLAVVKTLSSQSQRFGPIYDVSYIISMENTGNVTLTDLSLQDALANFIAPAVLFDTPDISVSGFTSGSANNSYDGISDTELLSSGASLIVGQTGTVELNARIDISAGGPQEGNTAFGNASELTEPVPSNDITITPSIDTDTNPTPLSLLDADGDGAPDIFESSTLDRDGDGVVDSQDYDPTGYFYCEENGAILPGGSISVTGPFGTNSSLGSLNNIVIEQDGSNGFFQFYVTQPGLYTVTPTYPSGGVPSTDRLAENGALDVSAATGNPVILGSSEVGSTGFIADASAQTNTPFYFAFDIEAGDPSVLLNNIPLKNCGTPALTLSKTVSADPELLPDGRQSITYSLTALNTGQTLIEDVRVQDDLASVFGASNIEFVRCTLSTNSTVFQGSENPSFDGGSDTETLIGDSDLLPGESVTIEVDVIVNPERDGEHINVASLSATSPVDGTILTDQASASVNLEPASDASLLRVTKAAQPRTVQIGDPILYTIAVTNETGTTMTDLDIIDRIPEGFAYVPNSATLVDGSLSLIHVARFAGAWGLALPLRWIV